MGGGTFFLLIAIEEFMEKNSASSDGLVYFTGANCLGWRDN